MKVAFVAEMFQQNPFAGIAVWAKRLTDFLETNDIENRIFSYNDCDNLGLRNKLKYIPNVRELYAYPTFGERISSQIEGAYDIVHFASPFTSVKHRAKTKSVVTVHYLISRQIEMLSTYLPLKYKMLFNPVSGNVFRRSERTGLSNVDLITVVRKGFKEYIIEKMNIPEDRIVYVPNGIDTDFFKPNYEGLTKEPTIIFVGRGSLAKGFDTLLKAAPSIKGNIIAVMSTVTDELRKIAEELPNVEIKMKLNAEQLRTEYQNAMAFVLPSLTEGNPISTLEAMACGLPVICTEEGSGENIEDGVNGFIFNFQDAQALAEKTNYLFENPEKAVEFGDCNRKLVMKNNSHSEVASRMLELYSKLKQTN